jgi:hypothetical protein
MSAGDEDWIDAVAAELVALGVLDPPLHEALVDALRAAETLPPPVSPSHPAPPLDGRGGVRVLAGGRGPSDPEPPFVDPPRLRLVPPGGSTPTDPSEQPSDPAVRVLALRGGGSVRTDFSSVRTDFIGEVGLGDPAHDGVFDVEPGETQVLQWRKRPAVLRVFCEVGDAEIHVDGAVLALHERCSADIEGKVIKVMSAGGARGEPTIGRYRSLPPPSRRPPSSS